MAYLLKTTPSKIPYAVSIAGCWGTTVQMFMPWPAHRVDLQTPPGEYLDLDFKTNAGRTECSRGSVHTANPPRSNKYSTGKKNTTISGCFPEAESAPHEASTKTLLWGLLKLRYTRQPKNQGTTTIIPVYKVMWVVMFVYTFALGKVRLIVRHSKHSWKTKI